MNLAQRQKSTVRIPSKKAAAAKAKRKASIAAAEDAKAEKLTLAEAVSVLRVRFCVGVTHHLNENPGH